jgi:penicillin-binding protein 1A
VRAATQLVLTGERRQGGSTITMQVARNFFLSPKKTFTRKLKEILLALRIEHQLSKTEILDLYLNQIYMGNRAYGVGAAAKIYYGIGVKELRLEQMAMLAALPKAPSVTNPIANPQRALQRRNYILGRMAELGYLDPDELQAALAAPDTASLHSATIELDAPYMAEMARAELLSRYGEEAYTRGLEVYTTLDSRLQIAADNALRTTLQDYDKRHGYRGPIAHQDIRRTPNPETWKEWISAMPTVAALTPALVTAAEGRTATAVVADGSSLQLGWAGLEWARPYQSENHRGAAPKNAAAVLKPGDLIYIAKDKEPVRDKKTGKVTEERPYWRLAEKPAVEGALVALSPDDGAIQALAGGYDFSRSKFNRVMQARRQPGSGFKAFIYSAALEAGFTPASVVNDAPLVIETGGPDGPWRPENFDGSWAGPIRLRVALYNSRNLVSVRVLQTMGLDHAIDRKSVV